MSRTLGSRNQDYDEQRLALARLVRQHLVSDGGMGASMRQLAGAANISVATLKHYFGDRVGVFQGVMEAIRVDAAPHQAMASSAIEGNVRLSLLTLLQRFQRVWTRFRVGEMLSMGLSAGLAERRLGPSFVQLLLEPSLQPAEGILARHVVVGDLKPLNVRHAALQLMSPVLMALFHQVNLLGVTCRPLDLDAFLEEHVDFFLRAHPPMRAGGFRKGSKPN